MQLTLEQQKERLVKSYMDILRVFKALISMFPCRNVPAK